MELLEGDFKRDFFLDAPEALKYGIIDQILLPKRPDKVMSKDDVKFGAFNGASSEGTDGEAPSAAA